MIVKQLFDSFNEINANIVNKEFFVYYSAG